uniref:Octanoyltransferase n=1 Tax=Lygus hesperus TaxID=30085 RepID=A0A0A9XYN7_LYGHE
MGKNDADWSYKDKDVTQKIFLEFLGVPRNVSDNRWLERAAIDGNKGWDPQTVLNYSQTLRERQERRGVYNAFTLGSSGRRITWILLDIRYHQNEVRGDILGERQWEFLRRTLDAAYSRDASIGSE